MSQTITLYVDGACRGNPGLGGWGAYIITETEEHKLCGGEDNTTNNRMELTATQFMLFSFCNNVRAPSPKTRVSTTSTIDIQGNCL